MRGSTRASGTREPLMAIAPARVADFQAQEVTTISRAELLWLLCGYCEGKLDLIVQRVMDAVQAIPGLVLALAIVSVLKPNTTNAMIAIAMVIIPGNSRIVRGAVLSAKQN